MEFSIAEIFLIGVIAGQLYVYVRLHMKFQMFKHHTVYKLRQIANGTAKVVEFDDRIEVVNIKE